MAGGTCYFCGAPETSREHVPPKSLFPQAKDTSDGVSYRDNPITVPSCHAHNEAKSDDDEYLFVVLTLSILNNPVGSTQAKTKVLRALEKKPGLAQKYFAQHMPVEVEDVQTGKREKTVAIRLDGARIDSALEHITRGIYFHHHQRVWLGTVKCFSEFQMSMDSDNPVETNERYEDIRQRADELFSTAARHGANPDVFFYQLAEDTGPNGELIIRMSFYEGTRATAILHP